jgi:hypothetical protein
MAMDGPSPKYPLSEKVADLELGKAAEHLVVADLILQGRRAYLTDQGLPYDVVVDIDGRLLRIQVKSTRCQKAIPQRKYTTPGYLFSVRRAGKGGKRLYSAADFDLVALVALDIRMIAYLPFDEAIKQTIYLRPVGHQPSANATRLRNIDGFPFDRALTAVVRVKR